MPHPAPPTGPFYRPVRAPELSPGDVLEHESGHTARVLAVGRESAIGERSDAPGRDVFLMLGPRGDALGRWRFVTPDGAAP